MTRRLEGVRIIALEQYGAGPYGSVHLADLGAEVIKIEDLPTRGDIGRYVVPFQEGEDSLFYETFNRNKKSLGLDLRTAAAGRSSRTWSGLRRGVLQHARRRPGEAAASGTTTSSTSTRRSSAARCPRSACTGPRASPATTTSCRPWPAGCR